MLLSLKGLTTNLTVTVFIVVVERIDAGRVLAMIKIDWNKFRVQNPDCRAAFEELAYHLFCRRYKIQHGLNAEVNQPGLETDPWEDPDDGLVGFQAKFFDSKIDYRQIQDSIQKARQHHPALNKIVVYVNTLHTRSKARTSIESAFRKQPALKVEWVMESRLRTRLSQPGNLDLAQFYFNCDDILGAVPNSVDADSATLIQSKHYIEVPLLKGSSPVNSWISSLRQPNDQKIYLVVGNPGSGKSLLAKKLYLELAGLTQQTDKCRRELLSTQKFLPMLVNLRSCSEGTIDSVIARWKQRIEDKGQKFFFIFDGLDEVSDSKADSLLSSMAELSRQPDTFRCVLTCRAANLSRTKARVQFPGLVEYEIGRLTTTHLSEYFEAKGNAIRSKKLKSLIDQKDAILGVLQDVLFVQLFWELIEDIADNSAIHELIDAKIERLLAEPHHQRQLEKLNLPEPKKSHILRINRRISAYLHKREIVSMSREKVCELISNWYERMDYRDANETGHYIASLFCDGGAQPGQTNSQFVYLHRRYQEYFFAQFLKREYSKIPDGLRKWKVLGNRDFFDQFFVPFLRRSFELAQDIVGVADVSLLETYLWRSRSFSPDEPYFVGTQQFHDALSALPAPAFNAAFFERPSHEGLVELRDVEQLRARLESWSKSEDREHEAEPLIMSYRAIGELLAIARRRSHTGQPDWQEIFEQAMRANDLFEKHEFPKYVGKERGLSDPIFEYIDDYFFLKVKTGDDFDATFKRVRAQHSLATEPVLSELSEKDRLVSAALKALLQLRTDELSDKVEDLEAREFSALVFVLALPDFLPLFWRTAALRAAVGRRTAPLTVIETEPFGIELCCIKRLLGQDLTPEQLQWLEAKRKELRSQLQQPWQLPREGVRYAQVTVALAAASSRSETQWRLPSNLNHREVFAALYEALILVAQGRLSIEVVLQALIPLTRSRGLLHEVTGHLIGQIIGVGWNERTPVQLCRRAIFETGSGSQFVPIAVTLQRTNKASLKQIFGQQELDTLVSQLDSWKGDFPKLVDRCFELSLLASDVDQRAAVGLFQRGISNSILRHGIRKDPIVSELLVSSFGLMWDRGFLDANQRDDVFERVRELTIKVKKITDGDGTWRGPWHLLEIVAKHDIEAARQLKRLLRQREVTHRDPSGAELIMLAAEIDLGLPLDDVIQQLRDLPSKDDGRRSRAEIFVQVAQSTAYSKLDRKRAFELAYQNVSGLTPDQRKPDFQEQDRRLFNLLSEGYGKELLFEVEEEKHRLTEKEVLKSFQSAATPEQIQSCFELLEFGNGVLIETPEAWNDVVQKTQSVCGNIEPLLGLFRKYAYPKMSFFGGIWDFMYFGLAACLGSTHLSCRREIFEHLKRNAGRDGFPELIKAYAHLGDKQMCVRLFERFLLLCEMLVGQ